MADPQRLTVVHNGAGTVCVVGEIDAFTSPDLEREIESVRSGASPVLDLSGVTFVDSSGLRVLVDQQQRLREAGADLVLHAPSNAVSRLLELSGLDGHFTVDH
jgi:anti-sigma B factor antagonist